MKKLLSLALAATFVLGTAATALAAENFTVNGTEYVRFQNKGGSTSWRTRLDLETQYKFSDEFSAYARFAGNITKGGDRALSWTDESGSVLDRWGVKWTTKDANVFVGRQGLVLGQDNLAVSAYVDNERGNNLQIDGVNAKFDLNKDLNWMIFAGKTTNVKIDKQKVYASQLNYKVAPDFALGGTYLSVEKGDFALSNQDFHSYSLFGTYDVNKKTQAYFEVVRSNADTDKNAYAIGAGYAFDEKNYACVNYFRQDKNSVLATFGNWGPGTTADLTNGHHSNMYEIYYKYKYSKDLAFNIDNVYEKGDTSVNRFRAQVTYSF